MVNLYGSISLPLLGDVQAEGLTPMELKEALAREFSEFVTEPDQLVRNIARAPTRELASLLTYLLLALLVVEMWAAMRFGGTK